MRRWRRRLHRRIGQAEKHGALIISCDCEKSPPLSVELFAGSVINLPHLSACRVILVRQSNRMLKGSCMERRQQVSLKNVVQCVSPRDTASVVGLSSPSVAKCGSEKDLSSPPRSAEPHS
jgi:hypothetical protein